MHYTLNQLRIFLKVSETLSVTKAAEELHLTQPAVSIQLKNFQEQFDLPIMEVINKRVFITDFGKEIAESAEKILSEVHAINYKMHAHQGKLTGKLKLSVVSTGKYVAPYFLVNFIRENEGVELFMDVTNKAQVLASLEQNQVDLALVSVLPETMQVEKVELMRNKLFVVGNTQRSFKKTKNDKEIFKTMPLIYREKGSGTRYIMEKYIQANELPVQKKMELTSNEAVKQAVIAGLGYSIMPLIGIKNELTNGQLQIIPVKGFPISSSWYLIWMKGKKLSPAAAGFVDYVQVHGEEIIREKFDWFEAY